MALSVWKVWVETHGSRVGFVHPVTVWCLMSSKHPSGDGDKHDLMVEGIRLLCIRKLIAIELLK